MSTNGANGEVIPQPGSDRPRSKRTLWVALTIVLGVLGAGVAGVSYAAYDFGQRYEGKILPGSTIAGIDVGGMRRAQAIAAVRASIAPQLKRKIKVSWKGHTWKVTPQRLGARSDAAHVVRAALRASSKTTFMDKMKASVFGGDFNFSRDVAITYPKQGARGFIEGLASSLNKKPVDASLDYSTGWVKILPSKNGRKVRVGASRKALRQALLKGSDSARLSVKSQKPKVTEDHFSKVLLVRIGENKLYLYENGKITHSWTVAPGQAAYPTPQGIFEITEKRYMPTWINPEPNSWGSTLPPEIPPGIGNPLGLRALNWSASGIRFHGTTATYTLGYNASHGCVRMSNPDVIQLYDLVDVGTPIVSVQVAPLKPLV